MDALDGRRSSRALGTLLVLGFLSAAAVASYASYEVTCNTASTRTESNDPAYHMPLVRFVPCEDDGAPTDDEAIDALVIDESVGTGTGTLSI